MALKTTSSETDPLPAADDTEAAPATATGAGRRRLSGGFLPSRLVRWAARPRQVTFTPSTFRTAGPLSFTRGGMFCNYVLGGQPWDFRSQDDRLGLWDQATFRWASLKGRSVKLRSTPKPYPSYEFARSLDEDTPTPLPNVPGGPSWDEYLGYSQRRLQQTGLDTKMVTLAVWIGPNPKKTVQEELIGGVDHPLPDTVRVIEEILQVSKILHGSGFDARPMGPREMAFLMHRSLSMGVPAPMHAGVAGGRWEPDDIAGFFSRREWVYEPLTGSTVKVVAEHQGRTVERHVAVLSVGPMPDITWPESGRDPWMLAADKLGFPVEWSMAGTMLSPKALAPVIEFEQKRAAGIGAHYDEHHLIPPPAVGRSIMAATQNLDEVTEGDTRTAVRFLGPVRVATYAATEAECLEQARALVDSYGQRLNFELAQPRGQAQLLREFVPGEPWSSVGYQRRIPARYLAAAMPHVDSEVGTPTGPYLGYGTGSARRAVRFDPHYGPEKLQQPGLFTITAEPGGGKALALDTPLPTPTGWTTMGEVQVGDYLVGADGTPTRVVAATEVMPDRPCYEMTFSDGTKIVADAGHQWLTETRAARASAFKAEFGIDGCRTQRRFPSVVTTEQVARTLRLPGGRTNHAVRVAAPLDLPDADLPVPPYVLGAWLGDGSSYHTAITVFDDEIITEIEKAGQECRATAQCGLYSLISGGRGRRSPLRHAMTELGVMAPAGRKHIPAVYLRASIEQRRALLAGLLDTDGTCTTSGKVEFVVTNEQLARDTFDLVLGLGYKATLTHRPCAGRTPASSTAYKVSFTPPDKVFRLTRKLARQRVGETRSTNTRRYIVEARPVPSVPVRCVQVDNDTHLYLASRAYVPTHNSVLIGSLAYNAVRRGEPTIILDPSGPLAKLCRMPELKPFSRVLDLTASAPGTLSPYQLIPDPLEAGFYDDDGRLNDLEFERARRRAVAERQQLMFDVLRMWLPVALLREPGTDVKLRTAIRNTRQRVLDAGLTDVETNPRWVVEALADLPGTEAVVAEIEAAAEFPLGELIMPDHTRSIPASQAEDKTLVVVTMPGLEPPPEGVDRELWGSSERYAQPLLHLAAFFTARFVYGRSRDVRKNVFLDENHLMGQWGSGRALMVRLSRDSRKWDCAVGAASQHPDDHLTVGRIDALQGAAFVGRLTAKETAEKACDLLQCPRAYAPVIQALSPKRRADQAHSDATDTGEFVLLDPLGRVGKIRIDIDWHPGLREALNTTPGRVRPPVDLPLQPTPFLEADLFTTIPMIPIDGEVAA